MSPMTLFARLALLSLLALPLGCGDLTLDPEPDSGCLAGSLFCPCAPGLTCIEGLTCQITEDGPQCQPACPMGTEDCPCDLRGLCDDGLVCQSDGEAERCVADCPAGTSSCPCTVTGACADGLACQAIDAGDYCLPHCPAGTPGCPCDEATPCGWHDGVHHTCLDATCRPDPCPAGQPGCVCDALGDCAEEHICQQGRCEADWGQTLVPPEDAACYTPCLGGSLTRGGVTRTCSDEGLLPGCINHAVCFRGSCVKIPAEGEAHRATCETGYDCPAFQNCIEGHCYSDCKADDDCRAPRACYRKACRVPCTVGVEGQCPPQHWCDATEGLQGYCMPSRPTHPQAQALRAERAFKTVQATASDVVLSASAVDFTGGPTRCLTVRNDSAEDLPISLTPRYHVCAGQAQGAETQVARSNADPLCWLSMAWTTGDRGDDCDGIDPGDLTDAGQTWSIAAGETATLVLTAEATRHCDPEPVPAHRLDCADAASWTGTVELAVPEVTHRTLSLAYTPERAGRFVGEMVYLADFNADHMNGDLAPPAVHNALLLRWQAFREGRINQAEFTRSLEATARGDWRPCPGDRNDPPNSACYRGTDRDGQPAWVVYSDDLATMPVPGAATRFDFALDLAPSGGPGEAWCGRVVGDVALNYPDSPGVTLSFTADDAGRLDLVTPGATLTSRLTGRYPAAGAACEAGFHALDLPWLVPGFTEGTLQTGQSLVRRFCVAGTADPEAQRQAMANPQATGADLTRTLTILDGARLPDGGLFLLFQEALPPLLTGVQSEGYGYLLLRREQAGLRRLACPMVCELDADCPEGLRCEDDRCVALACEVNEDCGNGQICAEGDCTYPEIDSMPTCADFKDRLAQQGVQGAHALSDHQLAAWLLYGRDTPVDPGQGLDPEAYQVFYLCHATGRMLTTSDSTAREQLCPPESEITYLAVPQPHVALAQAAADACGSDSGICSPGQPCDRDSGICSPGQPCDRGDALAADLAEDEFSDCLPHADLSALDRDDISDLGELALPDGCYAKAPCAVDTRCPSKGNCVEDFERWARAAQGDRPFEFTTALQYVCEDIDGQDFGRQDCDALTDRTRGKRFYLTPADAPAAVPSFQAAMQAAFRYVARFRSRHSGGSLGFVPWPCAPGTEAYCYDPEGIAALRARVDCAADLLLDGDWQGHVGDELARRLMRLLRQAVGFEDQTPPGATWSTYAYGFEYRYAELLIMLGDDALVNAYASRFDLAGQRVASFPGSALEADGLDLGSTAGFGMAALYRAQQSYQAVLDRFFALRPFLNDYRAGAAPEDRLLGPASAMSWLGKLVQASAGKARVAAELAEKYQQYGRPDLARAVVQRTYVATYLEGVYFGQLLTALRDQAPRMADRAQITASLHAAQARADQALARLHSTWQAVSDEPTRFGFTPSYVPSAPLDDDDGNLFEVLFARAREKAAVAAAKEQVALADTRAFDVDRAEFVSALTEIELDALGQIGELCGWVRVADAVYPATREFQPLFDDPALAVLTDPCGYAGNGQIYAAIQAVADAQDDLDLWKLEHANKVQAVRDTAKQLTEQCERIVNFADWRAEIGHEQVGIQDAINSMDLTLATLDRLDSSLATFISIDVFDVAGRTKYFFYGVAYNAVAAALEVVKVERAHELAEIEHVLIPYAEALQACDELRIDTQFAVRDKVRDLAEHTEDAAGLIRAIKTAVGQVITLQNLVADTQATRDEQRQLAVDVEAARNDPNVRVQRNAAVQAADRTFKAAVRAAWQATRAFEYYTNQTYGARDELALVPMVAAGDPTLEAYLSGLDDAFFEFEEQAGHPDLRVEVISLAEQIRPRCPGFTASDQPGTLAEQAQGFRCLLEGTSRDAHARLVLDVTTDLRRLSPLTHNHKIRFIEVELVGQDLGDDQARVYLRQKGGQDLGVLRAADGGLTYYTLPQRTAVVNASFSGERTRADVIRRLDEVTGDYYRSERLRDRPLHHGGWELVLDLQHEAVNRDIPLDRLEDIKIYLWYTDFTEN